MVLTYKAKKQKKALKIYTDTHVCFSTLKDVRASQYCINFCKRFQSKHIPRFTTYTSLATYRIQGFSYQIYFAFFLLNFGKSPLLMSKKPCKVLLPALHSDFKNQLQCKNMLKMYKVLATKLNSTVITAVRRRISIFLSRLLKRLKVYFFYMALCFSFR